MSRTTLGLAVAAFQSAPSTSAVVSYDGTILTVNDAWRRFGEQNGGGARCGPGSNYLAITNRAATSGDEVAATVAAALAAVFTGNAPSAQVDYPCHSPDQERWFRLQARPLSGRRAVLVTHDDITERVQLIRHIQRLQQRAGDDRLTTAARPLLIRAEQRMSPPRQRSM